METILHHIGVYECSVTVSPSLNYTSFENSTSRFIFNCTGTGVVLFWTVDGNASYTEEILHRGIVTIPLIHNITFVSAQISIPTTVVNNNTEVVCIVFDSTLTHPFYSSPLLLKLQGEEKNRLCILVQGWMRMNNICSEKLTQHQWC